MGGLDLYLLGYDKMETEYRSFATRLRLDFAAVVRKSIESMLLRTSGCVQLLVKR